MKNAAGTVVEGCDKVFAQAGYCVHTCARTQAKDHKPACMRAVAKHLLGQVICFVTSRLTLLLYLSANNVVIARSAYAWTCV